MPKISVFFELKVQKFSVFEISAVEKLYLHPIFKSQEMELGVFLRYLRLLQILVVTIVSFALSASFINVGSKEENPISKELLLGTGVIAAFFGIFSLGKCILRFLDTSMVFRVISLGLALFLNIFGIVLVSSSAHVIALWPTLFNRDLIYLSLGTIFVSLMIENFAQGRIFHNQGLEDKVIAMTSQVKVKKQLRNMATNTDNLEEMKEEEFTTPSVIFKDMRLSISDKDLETARKALKKSSIMSAGFDSIFKKTAPPTKEHQRRRHQAEDTCYIIDDTDFNRNSEELCPVFKPASSSP